MTVLDEVNTKLDKIIEMLSDRSKQIFKGETEDTGIKMDLTEVTVIARTEKAMLVLKKGYQKWIPFSQLHEDYDVKEFNEGDFLDDVKLSAKGEKWLPNKSWDKFKAVKNRG